MKVLVVVGTRPEAIKMAPVIAEGRRQGIEVIVCATAQHREMLDQVLSLFAIRPDQDLDLMRPDQTLADLSSRALAALDAAIAASSPDWLLVQGDTSTAMAAAMAGFYRRVPVGHVEAGLRTGDLERPFPEELNRRIVDAVCRAHFVPTETAREALRHEGFSDATLYLTGNTVVDALHHTLAKPCPSEALGPAASMGASERLVLVTAHRRESFGSGMKGIAAALREIVAAFADVRVVYPVHPNPSVSGPMHELLGGVPRIHLVEPLGYLPFVHLMARSYLILSDSGGVQEEAPALGVPALVLRDKTERPEAIAAGAVRLVGTEQRAIVAAAREVLDNPRVHAAMAHAVNPYGDGHAAERIIAVLKQEPWTPFASVPS